MKKNLVKVLTALAMVAAVMGFASCKMSIEDQLANTTWTAKVSEWDGVDETQKPQYNSIGLIDFGEKLSIEFVAGGTGKVYMSEYYSFDNSADPEDVEFYNTDAAENAITYDITWTVNKKAHTVTVTTEGQEPQVFTVTETSLTTTMEGFDGPLTFTKE